MRLKYSIQFQAQSQYYYFRPTGGGITERNLSRILIGSEAKEFHCSARSTEQSAMIHRHSNTFMGATLRPPEFSVKYADSGLIQRLNGISGSAESTEH